MSNKTFQLDLNFNSTLDLYAFEKEIEALGYNDYVRSADDDNQESAVWKLSFYKASQAECEHIISKLSDEISRFQAESSVICYSNELWSGAWEKEFEHLEIENYVFASPSSSPVTDKKVIYIDNDAFGTGEHATTKASLLLLEKLALKSPDHRNGFLDIGTGTGIFTAWAELECFTKVTGTDIIEEAIQSAIKTRSLNNLSYEVVFDSFPKHTESYDMVACNILPPELYKVFPEIKKRMHQQSTLIIAGFNESNIREVKKECQIAGLKVISQLSERGWIALALKLS